SLLGCLRLARARKHPAALWTAGVSAMATLPRSCSSRVRCFHFISQTRPVAGFGEQRQLIFLLYSHARNVSLPPGPNPELHFVDPRNALTLLQQLEAGLSF